MQYDTPDTIYNKPAALFVAGFAGAPAMNLADCTMLGGQADLGGELIRVGPDLAQRAAAAPTLKFGIRPENIRLERSADSDLAVPAEVSLLEPLGSETLVTLRIGKAEMVARCGADFRQAPGTRLNVHMNPRHLHLFDAASGAALSN
jgi:multiple sugar transport system ATP-binding protein